MARRGPPKEKRNGELRVADAVAGAALRTVTILEIGGLLGAPLNLERRLSLQDARALALTAALERHGVDPAAIGVEVLAADGSEREPPPPLLAKPMVIEPIVAVLNGPNLNLLDTLGAYRSARLPWERAAPSALSRSDQRGDPPFSQPHKQSLPVPL